MIRIGILVALGLIGHYFFGYFSPGWLVILLFVAAGLSIAHDVRKSKAAS